MIKGISIVMPCDKPRIPLLLTTLSFYMKFGIPENIEFILVSRTFNQLIVPGIDIKVMKYKWGGKYFNPSMAFNLGVKNATYNNIIITSPEVTPITNVLKQFNATKRGNYVCLVYDVGENGQSRGILVNSKHRHEDPSFYFLAMFKKEDLEKINGWDEEYMNGYAWEDRDFGARFVKAGLKFESRDDITAAHQYHRRLMTTIHAVKDASGYTDTRTGWVLNETLFNTNRAAFAKKGLTWVENDT